MKIITEYTVFFLLSNSAAMSGGQIVLGRNQGQMPGMPGRFPSEQDALDWIEGNSEAFSSGSSDFIILPVHRLGIE